MHKAYAFIEHAILIIYVVERKQRHKITTTFAMEKVQR